MNAHGYSGVLPAPDVVMHVFRAIRGAIISGSLAPFQPISVDDIAREYACEPWLVEHALISLSAEGLVEPDRTRVRSLTKSDALDLIEVHRVLRVRAAELGAHRLTVLDVARLRELRAETVRALETGDQRFAGSSASRFNQVIYNASGSPELLRMLAQSDGVVARMVNLAAMRGRIDPMMDRLQASLLEAAERRDAAGMVEQYVRAWGRFQLCVEECPDHQWPDWG